MRWSLVALALLAVVVVGCDDSAYQNSGRAPAGQVAGQLAPVDQEGQPLGQDTGEQSPEEPGTTEPVTVREGVAPGVSGRGDYGPGLITTPIRAYFRTQELLVFKIEIKQAMDMYKALEGHFPESQEEFMEKIIKENGIILPDLRGPNERYVYDPEKAATQQQYDEQDPPLMVERTQ
jgi:hypothetical protein